MINVRAITTFFETVKKRGARFYVLPVTPDRVNLFISGVSVGASLALELPPIELINARSAVLSRRGLDPGARDLVSFLQEKEMSPDEIIEALLDIEIEAWRNAEP